ncbi:MAG: AbrB/MazE/SpoVT family DNA-binding domain-containing protein [Gemmatimonadota bacterium]|nr:AbrB/MazE/SpoVT family DNA-binding domain-containing protein [Gemmatimonadota bacterium]MDE2677743.1 AbrB/MazE/SpoVT family DNA-binding domain-containing protein [Gemmatimonadota bacterium]
MSVGSHVAKWGSSLAVRIPKPIAEQWGVREGSRIELVSRGEHLVLRKKAYDLEEMVSRMTPDTLQAEVDTGSPQGKEAW